MTKLFVLSSDCVALARYNPIRCGEAGRALLTPGKQAVEPAAHLFDRLLRQAKMNPLEGFNDRQADNGEHPQRALKRDQLKIPEQVLEPQWTVAIEVIAMERVHEWHPDDKFPADV